MHSVITHAFLGATSIGVFNDRKKLLKFGVLGAICSAVPDLDAIGFNYGVPYGSFWGHRGFTHSLIFAVLLCLLVMTVIFREHHLFSKRWWLLCFGLFAIAASHGLLDALTNGGCGVALFSPFDNTRYFFPWRPILVSPMGASRFFEGRGLEVLKSEFLWVWVPIIVLTGGVQVIMMLLKFVKEK
jgi:inner membrane protein